MSTFWTKIIILGGLIVTIVIGMNYFAGKKSEPQEHKTIYDVWEEDDEKLRAMPEQTIQQQSQQTYVEEQKLVPVLPKEFRKLDEIDEMQVQRLYEQAIFRRKELRLGGMGAKSAIEFCREIISKYPGTIWEYKARELLSDIPQRFLERYSVTAEEITGKSK